MLYPYCKLLNILQQDKARLFQVIHSLAYLVQFWNNYENTQLAAKILFRLEKRWNDWEQPLLLLSCLLHPEYRMKQFKDNLDINYTTFGKWLIYYYQAWSEKESTCILSELPYKKYIYGNDTVYIWFIYVFINSVFKFRIFNKDLIFCDFIKTRCVCNL